MWFEGGQAEDQAYLAQFEIWGKVPHTPIHLPGLGRYGRLSFDSTILLSPCDLSVAQKKEWIFLADHFHKIDHFAFLQSTPHEDRKVLKKAYFLFSKQFHPDALINQDLGPFKKHGQLIFEYGRTVYELLSQDDQLRESYARVVQERDRSFRLQLEQERQKTQNKIKNKVKRKRELKSTQGSTSSIHISKHLQHLRDLSSKPHLKSSVHSQNHSLLGETPDSELRKAELRKRLQQNQDRSQNKNRQAEKVSKQILSFYYAGQRAEERSQWTRALNHYKMCVKYAPKEEEYRLAARRIQEQLNADEANQKWQKALDLDQLDMTKKAEKWYVDSLNLCLLEDRLFYWVKRLGDSRWEEQITWLKKGVQRWPHHLSLKFQLAQILEGQSQVDQAVEICKEILSYDPTEPQALKFLKKYGKG